MSAARGLTPQTVRFWAWVDSSVTWVLAVPPAATHFIALLYRINGWLGGSTTPPAFAGIQWLFVNLSGVLVSTWVIARLLQPTRALGLIDGWARTAVCLLLLYAVGILHAPRVLLLFVLTEGAGAIAQLWRGYQPLSAPT